MKNYRKMIMVTQEEYEKCKNPIDQKLSAHVNLPDDQRKLLDSITLNEVREKKTDVTSSVPSNVIEAFPRHVQSRARALIGYLRDLRKVEWNDAGEIRIKGSNFIAGSNIVDLVQHAVRDKRRRMATPRGWYEFKNMLIGSNVPMSVLGQAMLQEDETVFASPVRWATQL